MRAEFDADDLGRATLRLKPVGDGEIEIALAGAHIDDARIVRQGLNQGRKDLHHPVDLAELVLRVLTDIALRVGEPEAGLPGLGAGCDRACLGAIVAGGNSIAHSLRALQANLVAIALEGEIEGGRRKLSTAEGLGEPSA